MPNSFESTSLLKQGDKAIKKGSTELALLIYNRCLADGNSLAQKRLQSIDFQKKKIIVYVLSHKGFLFNLINFHILTNPEECAVAIVPRGYNIEHLCGLIKTGLFNGVVEYDLRMGFINNSVEHRQDIIDAIDNIFSSNKIDVGSISRAYLFADCHDVIGSYLALRNVNITIVEIAPNQSMGTNRYELMYSNGKGILGEDLYKLQKEQAILCSENGRHNVVFFNNEWKYDATSFDHIHSFSLIPDEYKRKILSAFNYDGSLYASANLLLPSSGSVMLGHGIGKDDCSKCIDYLASFFGAAGHVCIKLHPYSFPPDSYLIPDSNVLSGDSPIDLIAYSDTEIINCIGTSASSVEKIEANCRTATAASVDFYDYYTDLPYILAIAELCAQSDVFLTQNYLPKKDYDKLLLINGIVLKQTSTEYHIVKDVQQYEKTKNAFYFGDPSVISPSDCLVVNVFVNSEQSSEKRKVFLKSENKDSFIGKRVWRSVSDRLIISSEPVHPINADDYMDLASNGCVSAMYELGIMYKRGIGVEKDLKEAERWLSEASEHKHGGATILLFDTLWDINTPESLTKMIDRIAIPAAMGDGTAIAKLSMAYLYGKGVSRDVDAAKQLMKRAIDLGVSWIIPVYEHIES